MTKFISFARRHNQDSTVDSICSRCYQTIASGDSEATLATIEEGHSCDPNCEYNGYINKANSPCSRAS
jgi:hypothetical protein